MVPTFMQFPHCGERLDLQSGRGNYKNEIDERMRNRIHDHRADHKPALNSGYMAEHIDMDRSFISDLEV